MASFEWVADEEFKQQIAKSKPLDVLMYGKALADTSERQGAVLTKLREKFFEQIASQDNCLNFNYRVDLNQFKYAHPNSFPKYSAKLELVFALKTPLITKDDDAFHLFDNPVRKDHALMRPYMAPATLLGLSSDAFIRAFPGGKSWEERGKEALQDYRSEVTSARRLFGLVSDGNFEGSSSQKGRLSLSPIWFSQTRYLTMNPRNPENAQGTFPIQFEAVKEGEQARLEVLYFNPYLAEDKEDSEQVVREDLSRWLYAIASYWPLMGLGAKRAAGYGQIEIQSAKLYCNNWALESTDEQVESESVTEMLSEPEFLQDFLSVNGSLISRGELEERIKSSMVGESKEVSELKQAREALKKDSTLDGTAKKKKDKEFKKQLDKLKKLQKQDQVSDYENIKNQMVAKYDQCSDWFKYLESKQQQEQKPPSSSQTIVADKEFSGIDSWEKMARFIYTGAAD